ncbi:conjugative transfer region protein, TIGR03750 family [Dyella jiangningensis]|jgi:conjugative transfer region protein (TIGR03750 family)|uniref:TIGR03750 family conjugal transfer protein n=1 Tax=Pseudomonadota TaxID=1224 RepID=UPI000885CCED|nr:MULTISPECIES: TIGR03750 family conjugal transfer protein [Pseudomonadota]PXV59728.1 conjugative transfer region protein (TIGR03750 family) [Dyella sp. AtDHG13]UCF23414.1 MAG: TIGR03750 family conjugal transfer protein [Ralstonia sp.]SDJ25426.1 conjugative transfer region protein, TIGR03750 family [Dyella jiangningensis]HNR82283.1 TIGR03750 family conjugal transfer protein [Ottowia sp.]
MAGHAESLQDAAHGGPRDGLVSFLPHRLNRDPVVVRGLTADELWVCAGLSAAAGFMAGLPLAWLTRSIAMVPTLIVLGIGVGVFVGGGLLRRYKRGRPDTWLYRQLQWRLALRYPALAAHVGGGQLITRSGWWSTRRLLTNRRSPAFRLIQRSSRGAA